MKHIQIGIRVLYRLCLFIYYLTGYLLSSFRIHLTTKDPIQRRIKFSTNGYRYTTLARNAFGIEVRVVNPPPVGQRGLVIGNHMGFVDILVVCSLTPSLFVTSEDMRETPLLGLITEMAGCIYVDRRSRKNILKELNELIEYLKQGFRVVIYPEATSHNGEEILPFKRTLITSAAHANVPVLPYVFNFLSIDGKPFSLKNRDSVCWFGDTSFVTAMLRMFTVKSIVCEVKYLEPVLTIPEDSRAEVANRLQKMIANEFQPVLEKRT